MKTNFFLESTQNQRCFNVEFYQWINVDKWTLNQRVYHVDQLRDVISTYINIESTLSVWWKLVPKNSMLTTFILKRHIKSSIFCHSAHISYSWASPEIFLLFAQGKTELQTTPFPKNQSWENRLFFKIIKVFRECIKSWC